VIPVLLAIALAGLALWILAPLRAPSRRAGEEVDTRWKELVDAKHAVYRCILDLEFDRAVGKVSEEDYTVLRRQQEVEALGILTEMDALASTAEASRDTLEAEIAAARARLRPS
jgi:metal-dependent amidase/aminoacylase/carboxypeptidase family protein